MYTYQTRISYSETGENGTLRPAELIDAFQNCSTFQSEALGIGPAYAIKKQEAWLVASWHIQVERLPVFGEAVEISTWPYKMDRLFGYRNFTMRDASGELLACADSCWFYFDNGKQALIRVSEEMKEILGKEIEPALSMEKQPRKIALPDAMEQKTSFPVRRSDLDTNHHMNNGRYVHYAAEYLEPDAIVRDIRVEYVKAAMPEDIVYPQVRADAGITTVNLSQEDGKPFAVVQFLTE